MDAQASRQGEYVALTAARAISEAGFDGWYIPDGQLRAMEDGHDPTRFHHEIMLAHPTDTVKRWPVDCHAFAQWHARQMTEAARRARRSRVLFV